MAGTAGKGGSLRGMGAVSATVVLAAVLTTAACGSGGGRAHDGGRAGTDRITVVASTPVWRDIAAAVGGDAVDTRSIIPAGVDPHEFQAAPGDALAVADADIIVANGGGYDGFVGEMVHTTGGGARLVDAYALTAPENHDHGHDHGDDHDHGEANEHVWFDFDTVDAVADALAEEMATLDPGNADGYRSRSAALHGQLDAVSARTDAIAAARPAPVLSTEPVAHYLLDAAGIEDLTPPEFGEAVEHGSDPAPADIARMRGVLESGRVSALVYNTQADGPAAQSIRRDAERVGVPVVEVSETPPDGAGYVGWVSHIIDGLQQAVTR